LGDLTGAGSEPVDEPFAFGESAPGFFAAAAVFFEMVVISYPRFLRR
jgi:hypothetical protein